MDTKTLFQTLAKVGLCLSSLLVTNCSKTVSHADALLKEEEQVLVQSSFYPGEMNPQAVQRYGNSLAISTSTAGGTDGGVITNPNAGTGGSDTGSIPAPGGSTGGSTTNPSNPSTGGSTGGTAGTTPTTPSNPSTPPPSSGTVDGGTPSTPSNPSTPTAPSNPSTPAPGGSDGGTIIGGNPSGGSDTGTVPPSNGGGNDGGSAPSNPTTPSNPSTPGDTAGNNPPSTPSNPSTPTTPTNPSNPGDVAGGPSTPSNPSNPSNPAPGGSDGGTVPGGSNPPAGGSDGGTVGQNPNPGTPSAPSNPTTPTNPSTPTTPTNPGDTAGNNPPSTPSNPSTPGGGITPPGTTPGGPIASNPPVNPPGTPAPGGNDGGTVPGTNPPGGGTDGGTTPPVVPPVVPPVIPPVTPPIAGSGMDVQINRVCSVMRSRIPYPGFVFFEDAARPIVAFESMVDMKKKACVSVSYYQQSNKKTQIAAVGLMGMLDRMERTESNLMRLIFEKIDLKDVDLISSKFKTAVQFKLAQVKTLFPATWKKIYLNATVCDDTTKDGSCIDETQNRILSISSTGVELGKLPKLLNLYVWSGRHLTLKGDPKSCEQQYSPLVLDLDGNGFALTGPEHGMTFDLNDTGVPVMTGWAAGKDDAFLVRDINGNGDIDSGAELFGSATRLKSGGRAANGFAALAELDSNGDGVVSSADEEWDSLRLWIDANFDGHAQPKEMYKLSEKQIESIRVDYMDLMEVDRYGNQTRQRSTFRRTVKGVSTARMVIDVWFNTFAIQH